MTDKSQISGSAVEAARKLIGDDGCRLFVHDGKGGGQWEDLEHVAQLIDDTTQVSELRRVLTDLQTAMNSLSCGECDHVPHVHSCIECGCQADYTEGFHAAIWAVLSKVKE